jgi:dTDP-4-dehydrorhamnose 3,5-epimerase-like enzyme
MNEDAKLTVGGCHTDERGSISYINDFDMTPVKRFYCIKHPDTTTVRAWRAHKIEQRWFHVSEGSFEIKLVKINDWQNPDRRLVQKCYLLNAKENVVLHVPKGFASSIKACEENSELFVFADYLTEHAKNDDYLFPSDYFLAPKNSIHEN